MSDNLNDDFLVPEFLAAEYTPEQQQKIMQVRLMIGSHVVWGI